MGDRAAPRRRSMQPALVLIEAALQRRLSLDECARACALSPWEWSRRFRAEHGITFSRYVLRRRIERAKALLAAAPCRVSEVAFAVGFNDLSHFARVFRRSAGLPASEWLALHLASRPNG